MRGRAREAPDGRQDMARRQSEDLGRLVFEPVVVGAARAHGDESRREIANWFRVSG
jgi:hypothetical protein